MLIVFLKKIKFVNYENTRKIKKIISDFFSMGNVNIKNIALKMYKIFLYGWLLQDNIEGV